MWGKHYKKICFVLTAFNILIASWFFLNGDLYFHSDIGRDFMLLAEIEEKGYILIGARTGASGVYHGVFWYFLNFPAYFLSNGNPVVVEGFWILLSVAFLAGGFWVCKNLFSKRVGYYFIVLASSYLVWRTNTFSHPDGATLLTIFFFYTFWKYIETLKLKYLAVNVFLSGFLIHLELVTGWPLFLLSVPLALIFQYKGKKLLHASAFFLILIPLLPYIVFELRHDFFQLRNLWAFITQSTIGGGGEHYSRVFINRLEYMFNDGIKLVDIGQVNRVVVGFFVVVFMRVLFASESKRLYFTFLYFFMGFFIFSLAVPFFLLRHHFVTFYPVVLLVFCSVLANKYGKVLLPLFFLVVVISEIAAIGQVMKPDTNADFNRDSWKSLNAIASDVFTDTPGEFGYFVNSPDKFGYSANYAMVYRNKVDGKNRAQYFEKRPVTYVVTAPPPLNSDFDTDIWMKNGINIKTVPTYVNSYSNGYKVYRFDLSNEDVAVPYSPLEDIGIHFR